MKFSSAVWFYHLSPPSNQVLMRPAYLDHIRIKRHSKWGRTFLIERSACVAAMAATQRVSDSLVQKEGETNT